MATDPKAEITEKVKVTRQQIVVAKAFLCRYFDERTNPRGTARAIEVFLKHVGAVALKSTQSTVQEEWVPPLSRLAEAISWEIAAHEAVLELLHSSQLIGRTGLMQWYPVVQYERATTDSGSWQFSEFQIDVPGEVHRPHSTRYAEGETLADADLYLQQVAIPDLPEGVSDALKETVACFRHELFTAAVVMLGKASEEAWIETGLAVCAALPGDHSKTVDKLTGLDGVAKKTTEVRRLYESADAKLLITTSGVTLTEFRHAVGWSELVRESRNVVHFGNDSSTPNTYEKVAVLLLGVPRVFRSLFAVRRASIDLVSQSGT